METVGKKRNTSAVGNGKTGADGLIDEALASALAERWCGVAPPEPALQRLLPLPEGASTLTVPLLAAVVGRRTQGWRRVGSVSFSATRLWADLSGAERVLARPFAVATGQASNWGEGRAVVVFAALRGGARVYLGRCLLTPYLERLRDLDDNEASRRAARFLGRGEPGR